MTTAHIFIAALMGTIVGSGLMLMLALALLPTAKETVGEYMSRLAKRRWRKRK